MQWLSRLIALGVLGGAGAPGHLIGATLLKNGTFGGMTVNFKVALPDGFDPRRTYPTLLAFGGGPQTMPMVDAGLFRYWGSEGRHRGYIIVSPAAPEGQFFHEKGARIFPEFLDMILHDYKVQGGKMHIAGFSNGGVSAFYVASQYPQYFWSVTGLPGLLRDATDARLEALRPMCIYMHVGGFDPDWGGKMEQQSEVLKRQGCKVQFHVEANQYHFLSLGAEDVSRLFDDLDAAARGCGKQ